MIRPHRSHPLWYAFILHRVSGLTLALFLPFHFYVLALALTEPETFGEFIKWVEYPLVKFAEFGLVLLLAAHLTGGVRLLIIEFLPWNERQKAMLAATGGIAFGVSVLFLLNAV